MLLSWTSVTCIWDGLSISTNKNKEKPVTLQSMGDKNGQGLFPVLVGTERSLITINNSLVFLLQKHWDCLWEVGQASRYHNLFSRWLFHSQRNYIPGRCLSSYLISSFIHSLTNTYWTALMSVSVVGTWNSSINKIDKISALCGAAWISGSNLC